MKYTFVALFLLLTAFNFSKKETHELKEDIWLFKSSDKDCLNPINTWVLIPTDSGEDLSCLDFKQKIILSKGEKLTFVKNFSGFSTGKLYENSQGETVLILDESSVF